MWQIYIVTAKLVVVTLFTIGSIFVPSQKTEKAKIVIVGAGPSGIAAATRLLENGINDIIILEAENRIGGRVNTVKLGDGVIDLGGQWVHGEKDNAVFSMASPLGLLMNSINGEDDGGRLFVNQDGQVINETIAEQYYEILNEIVESTKTDLVNYKGSLGEYFDQEFPKKLSEKSLRDPKLEKQFLNWFHKAQNSMDAADSWYETSGYGETTYHESEGKQNWAWKSGYGTILEVLMKKIPDPSKELPVRSKIRFNCEVQQITWDNLPEENENKTVIKCLDGSTYIADQVIVTVSLGVLKERAQTMFNPALSSKKLSAIKGLSIGTVDKIFLKFPHKWWPKNYVEFNILWADETHPCKTMDCWMKDVFIFHEVDNHPNVLCGWVTGPAARHMEQLPIEQVKEESIKLLDKFVAKPLNISIPQPIQILRSTWYSNPHFRGSYSFRSMETEALGVSAADLAKPMTNKNGLPVLMFAGEATHSRFYSTVHGAIESGWREADRISRIYKSEQHSS